MTFLIHQRYTIFLLETPLDIKDPNIPSSQNYGHKNKNKKKSHRTTIKYFVSVII